MSSGVAAIRPRPETRAFRFVSIALLAAVIAGCALDVIDGMGTAATGVKIAGTAAGAGAAASTAAKAGSTMGSVPTPASGGAAVAQGAATGARGMADAQMRTGGALAKGVATTQTAAAAGSPHPSSCRLQCSSGPVAISCPAGQTPVCNCTTVPHAACR